MVAPGDTFIVGSLVRGCWVVGSFLVPLTGRTVVVKELSLPRRPA